MLRHPPFPESLAYLHGWLYEVHGHSGASMSGLNLLTWECLDAWARRTGREPYAHECSALMHLDFLLCHPEESPSQT